MSDCSCSCVTTIIGGCTPVRDGSDLSHPCDEGKCFGLPGVPEYVLNIKNPDDGVNFSSSGGVVTVIGA